MLNVSMIFGYRLDIFNSTSFFVKSTVVILQFLFLLSCLTVNGWQSLYSFRNFIDTILDTLQTTNYYFHTMGDEHSRLMLAKFSNFFYRYFLLTCQVPLIFAFQLHWTGSWLDLWHCLQKIQEDFKLDKRFFLKCRKICHFKILLFILVIYINIIIAIGVTVINSLI